MTLPKFHLNVGFSNKRFNIRECDKKRERSGNNRVYFIVLQSFEPDRVLHGFYALVFHLPLIFKPFIHFKERFDEH